MDDHGAEATECVTSRDALRGDRELVLLQHLAGEILGERSIEISLPNRSLS